MKSDALGDVLPQAHARAAAPGENADLTVALSTPVSGDDVRLQALGQRLAARVAANAQANAAFLTLRKPLQAQAAQVWGPGLRAWPLRGGSWIVEAEAGVELTPPAAAGALELLVLVGQMRVGDQSLAACAHALLPADAKVQAGAQGLLRVYLRRHGQAGPFQAPAQALLNPAPSWQPLREGVDISPLYGEGAAVSLLARFAPGGRVPGHPHGIDEECLMVDGDLFLGDLLLREGEFQFAPSGSQHGELFADAPCLLFFHGAIDAAAIDNGYRQGQGWPAL